MRLLTAFLVFAAFTAGGLLKSSELKRRTLLLRELVRLVSDLSAAIRCTAPTLDELAEDCRGVFGELLRESRRASPDSRTAWLTAAKRLGGCTFCGREEAALLLSLAGELGTSPAESQLSMLKLYGERLQGLLSDAEQLSRSRGKLCRSVGALLGAGAAIMIV